MRPTTVLSLVLFLFLILSDLSDPRALTAQAGIRYEFRPEIWRRFQVAPDGTPVSASETGTNSSQEFVS